EETVASCDRTARWGDPCRLAAKRRSDFEQCDIRCSSAAQRSRGIEVRMTLYRSDVFQRKIADAVDFRNFVVSARRHTMGGGQHKAAGKCNAAARAARTDQHNERASGRARR